MSKTKQVIGILLVLGMFVLMACAPKAAPAPAPQPPAPAPAAAPAPRPVTPAVPAAPVKPAWEAEWEKTLTAAKQEGKVIGQTPGGADIRAAMVQIAKLQGISAEITVSRSAELLAKILAERKAGLYLWDVHVGGFNTILTQMKPAGILEPLDPALILPDLTDPERIKQVWYQGKLPWVDKDHMLLRSSLHSQLPLVVNVDQVKPDEIKSYRDLLDPKWRGKLIVGDPTVAGAGQQSFQGMLEVMGEDFVKELAATNPIVMRDQRLQVEWVAQGKAAILVSPQPETVIVFLKLGAPIRGVIPPKEGAWLTSGSGGIVWFKNSPHPNAAKVFINMITSKEGQEIFAPAAFHQSLRLDASTAHLPPDRIRKEGYVDLNTEEASTGRNAVASKLAKDIFGPLVK